MLVNDVPGTIATRVAPMKDPDNRAFGTLPTERDKPRQAAQPRSSETVKLEPGLTLGKYRIVQQLGAGGMGTVYRAEHVEIAKPVALKVLSSALATDPIAQARFLREAESASRLEHRHVVSVTDFGSENGIAYLVMELLRGEDLAGYLNKHPRGLAVEDAVGLMLSVCSGVAAAHAAGIIHRDLKPRNIFLAQTALREVEAKVLDFGVSKVATALDASLTGTGEVIGTTHYMSPEQIVGRDIDPRTDQYSLGVVLYECLTGRRPYEGDSALVIMKSIGEGRCVPPTALRPGLPRALEEVVLTAMAREAPARFESVHALGAALMPFASRKHRVLWGDYYGAGARDASAQGGGREQAPAASPFLSPVMVRELRSSEAAMPRTARLPTDERLASNDDDDAGEVGGSGSGSYYGDLAPPRRHLRWLVVLASAVVGFVVVALLVTGRSPRGPRPLQVRTAPEIDEPAPRRPQPPIPAPDEPPPARGENPRPGQSGEAHRSEDETTAPPAQEKAPLTKPSKRSPRPTRPNKGSTRHVDYTDDGSPILQ